jgi:Ca-activated chloride channel family protein
MIRRTSALAALTALAAALTFVNAVPAAAEGELSPVMVVLDSSGSMTARDVGGSGTRMDAAKRAVGSMVDGLPAEAQVGLAIYGAGTGSSGAEKAAGCKDVRVVQPVGAVNKPALKRAVAATKASGYTPIGQALRTAAAQLPKEGQRSVVLVSDGEDTCAPPQPCEVAKELHQQGVDLHVHTIGFRVDAKARAQLACIAQNTGGTYHDAADADSLLGVLGRVTERALRHYEPTGKPVAGTGDPFTAPTVTPGQYLDTIDPVEERFYAGVLRGDRGLPARKPPRPRGGRRQDHRAERRRLLRVPARAEHPGQGRRIAHHGAELERHGRGIVEAEGLQRAGQVRVPGDPRRPRRRHRPGSGRAAAADRAAGDRQPR